MLKKCLEWAGLYYVNVDLGLYAKEKKDILWDLGVPFGGEEEEAVCGESQIDTTRRRRAPSSSSSSSPTLKSKTQKKRKRGMEMEEKSSINN